MTRAVCFDVDFTLIYPGPTFQGEGYQRFCARHGIAVDAARFEAAVAGASAILDRAQELIYDPRIFIDYTTAVIRGMGGEGPGLDACAREIYDAWAANHHFHLYEEVPEVLQDLAARGLRLGVISNSHRPLDAFLRHFGLERLVTAAVSSLEHGYMKPHPSIFEAALARLGATAAEAVMVGDSFAHDIEGARQLGMKGVLVSRSGRTEPPVPGVPVIRNLRELAAHLELDP